jgi:CRP-like cAMP-binding protein
MPDGQAQFCALLLPGDLIGAASMMFDRPTEDVIALTSCELDTADPSHLWEAARTQAGLAALLMWHACEEARRLSNWVVALGRGRAEQRVALLLIEIRARLIRAGELEEHDLDFPFPLTQQVIGDTLGLTAVHVNRVLKKMREDGLASVRGARAFVTLHELATLAAPLLDPHERRAPEFGLVAA